MTTTKAKGAKAKAVGYLRTSSATNAGQGGDSEKRQRGAIAGFAKAAGFDVVDWFYDAAVSGADPIETRPGFAALLDRIEGNGVRVVLVEDASRFARELVVQELGIVALIRRDVRVLTATGDDLTATDDPFKIMVRQVAGAFAQLEKARLVAKLKAARDRKSAALGRRVEGPPPAITKEIEERIRVLARKPKGKRRLSLREIAAALAAEGVVNPSTGKPFSHTAIALVLGPRPRTDD